jgi:hypothetical protein
MAMLTPAEEAAIRRITPMVSIVRLTQGNLAAKGNTSCLFQKSNIGNVLPHLPQHCKYIVIQRRGPRAANDVKSTKVRKSYIHEALVLLKGTGLEAWDVEISLDNLSQWPQDGDILDLVTDMRVIEVDEEGQPADVSSNHPSSNPASEASIAVPTNRDGGDAGPAPLQNDVIPEETFEGVANVFNNSTVNTGQANLIEQAIMSQVCTIRSAVNAQNTPAIGNAASVPTYTVTGDRAVFQQNEMFDHSGGFADMNRTKYAWAMAFPTVFVPTWITLDGVSKWVILNDITGWETIREKPVTFNAWVEHMVWRSDGKPASHPTFALVLNNHKMKSQLQRQGQYVANTSDFDLAKTIQDFRDAPNKEHQQVKEAIHRLVKTTKVVSGNIVGTPQYWKSKFHEFRAKTFFNSYIKGNDISVFHTGSLAEFHEFFLRRLLCLSMFMKYPLLAIPPTTTSWKMTSHSSKQYKCTKTSLLITSLQKWKYGMLCFCALFTASSEGICQMNLRNQEVQSTTMRGVRLTVK